MILVDSVTKSYKDKKVLENVSFKIDGGEFVSIVGASGAGKSTLIHAFIGATKVDEGYITVDDLELNNLSSDEVQDYRRRIGIIFQDFKLLPRRSVFENVAFALEVAGYSDSFVHQRTVDVLKVVGLEEHRNKLPHELSGGEKQRTAIARALVHAPQLLFADEPTGNLDPENTEALAKLLLKINKSGTTIIMATHNKDVVDLIKKRVITLENGKLTGDRRSSGYQK